MAGDVTIVMKANDAEVVAAWLRARQGLKQFGDELDAVGKKGRKAKDGIAGGVQDAIADFGRAAMAIAGVGSVLDGIMTAADLLRSEFEMLLARQRAAAEFQVTRAAALREAAWNMGERPEMSVSSLNRWAEDTGLRLGVDQVSLLKAAGGAFATVGDMPADKVLETVTTLVGMNPGLRDTELQKAVIGTLMTQREFGVSADRAAAGTFLGAQASPTPNMAEYAENALPAVRNLRSLGGGKDSANFLFGLVSGAQNRMGDASGKITATALMQLATQVMPLAQAGLGRTDISLEEAIEFIRSDAGSKARSRLLGTGKLSRNEMAKLAASGEAMPGGSLHGEMRARQTMIELLSPENTAARQAVAAARSTVGNLTEGDVKAVRAFSSSVEGQPAMIAERIKRTATSGTEFIQSDVDEAVKGIVTEEIPKLLAATGQSSLELSSLTGVYGGSVEMVRGRSTQERIDVAQAELMRRRAFIAEEGGTMAARSLPAIDAMLAKLAGIEAQLQRLNDAGNQPQQVRVINQPSQPQTPGNSPAAALND